MVQVVVLWMTVDDPTLSSAYFLFVFYRVKFKNFPGLHQVWSSLEFGNVSWTMRPKVRRFWWRIESYDIHKDAAPSPNWRTEFSCTFPPAEESPGWRVVSFLLSLTEWKAVCPEAVVVLVVAMQWKGGEMWVEERMRGERGEKAPRCSCGEASRCRWMEGSK